MSVRSFLAHHDRPSVSLCSTVCALLQVKLTPVVYAVTGPLTTDRLVCSLGFGLPEIEPARKVRAGVVEDFKERCLSDNPRRERGCLSMIDIGAALQMAKARSTTSYLLPAPVGRLRNYAYFTKLHQ